MHVQVLPVQTHVHVQTCVLMCKCVWCVLTCVQLCAQVHVVCKCVCMQMCVVQACVDMCVQACASVVCADVCLQMCVLTRKHLCVCKCVQVCLQVHVGVHADVCECKYMCSCVVRCVQTCVHVQMCVCEAEGEECDQVPGCSARHRLWLAELVRLGPRGPAWTDPPSPVPRKDTGYAATGDPRPGPAEAEGPRS